MLLLRLRQREEGLLLVLGEAASNVPALQLANELLEVLLELLGALHATALQQLAVEQPSRLLHNHVAQVVLGSGDLGLLCLRDEFVEFAVLAAWGFLELRVVGQVLAEDGVEQLLGALGGGHEVLPELVGHAEAGGLDVANAFQPHAVLEGVDQMLLEVMEGGEFPAHRLFSAPRAVLLVPRLRISGLSVRLYSGF